MPKKNKNDVRPSEGRNALPINLFGEVTPEMSLILAQQLQAERPNAVDVLLCSEGGHIGDGLAIHDLLAEIPMSVIKATGFCASAGALILQAGRFRVATPNTQFLLHGVRPDSDGTEEDRAEAMRIKNHLDQEMTRLFSNRMGRQNYKTALMLGAMNAETAVRLKLIDGIEYRGEKGNAIVRLR